MGAVIDALANFNPTGFALRNQQAAANVEATKAGTAQTETQTQGLAQQQAMVQRQLQDADVIRRAYMNTSGEPTEVRDYLLKNGVSGTGFMGWQQHAYDMQTKAAQLSKEQREAEAQLHDQAGNIIDTINGIKDPAAQATAYAQELPRLQKLAPDVRWEPPESFTPDHGQLYSGILGHAKNVLEQTKTRQEIEASKQSQATSAANEANLEAELPGKKAESELKVASASALKNKSAADWENDVKTATQGSKDKYLYDRTLGAVRLALSRGDLKEADAAVKEARQQMREVEVAKENAQNRLTINMGDFGGSTGQPSATAQAVADYREPLQTALARVPPPARESLMKQIMAANPDFHAENYMAYQAMERDATSGKIATSANALNTMMGHLEVLDRAGKALAQHDVQGLNKIANAFGVATGDNAATVYDTIVHRVGPEVTKAYLAAGGSVGERGTNEEDFARKLSPAQREANIAVSAQLADSKIKALQDQYSRGTYGRGKQKLISDEAESARQRLAGKSPVADVTKINTKEEYDKLPKGAKYIDAQDGKQYTKK